MRNFSKLVTKLVMREISQLHMSSLLLSLVKSNRIEINKSQNLL